MHVGHAQYATVGRELLRWRVMQVPIPQAWGVLSGLSGPLSARAAHPLH
jgi:hypothetical protein